MQSFIMKLAWIIFITSIGWAHTMAHYQSMSEPSVGTCSDRFKCEYHVLQKLVQFEEQMSKKETEMESLKVELKEAKSTVSDLTKSLEVIKRSNQWTTYVRWGRTTCPGDAFVIYQGYAAGSSYHHSGTASNTLCLPTDPDFDKFMNGFQASGRIYGGEYETSDRSDSYKSLHDQDVPCAVCRIPRSNVIMVPGKNTCHDEYVLEYKGYLMSEYFGHDSAGEFVCVDDKPEVIEGGSSDKNGRLFYFVEAVCGSLKCPPYVDGRELTCAVCSYSPGAK